MAPALDTSGKWGVKGDVVLKLTPKTRVQRDGQRRSRLMLMHLAFIAYLFAVWMVVLACEVQARLCAEGVGLAVLLRPLGDAAPGLARVDLGEPPPSRDTWVGYHRDQKNLARLRALLALLTERFLRATCRPRVDTMDGSTIIMDRSMNPGAPA